jgi:dipeptide/tripeptide permease
MHLLTLSDRSASLKIFLTGTLYIEIAVGLLKFHMSTYIRLYPPSDLTSDIATSSGVPFPSL